MIPNLHICLLPMPIKWGDKEANLNYLEEKLREVHPGTDLLILPEMFSTGFITSGKEEVRALAERNSGETVDFLKRLAARHGLAIAGSFIADTGGSLFNRAFFIDSYGEEAFADKRHLFTMGGEDKIFSAGDSRLSVRYRGWNISMVVCYDIRFPVWCRNKENEYDLLIAVANWPKARVEAWTHLLKARALENLSYVCGVNCTGTDLNGYSYDGASHVFDFKGADISMRSDNSDLIYASLSHEKLLSFRQKFPAWKDADSFEINLDI
ncbi:MAG: nitrilase family protein [Muribaculaceae bacterium]|nr:nitrilase family protein [Muribaculaceae bacterium]